MDFYQPLNSANQQNLLNSTMIMPDGLNGVAAALPGPLNTNAAANMASMEEMVRVQSSLQAQLSETRKKNLQLENELDNLRREVSSFEITCRVKQLEFEADYVKSVEHKLIRSKQEKENQLKQHIEDLTNTKAHMEAHFKETIEQKDQEIELLKSQCDNKREFDDKFQALQASLEKTQNMNLGLIEQLEISKLELEELRNSKKSTDDLYGDDEVKQFVRLLKEIRSEEQDYSNNNKSMMDNLTKSGSGSLLASALEGDDNQYAFKELAGLDRSALIERVQVFAKLIIKQQQKLRDVNAETKRKIDGLETDLKNKTVLHEALAIKLTEKNQQILSLSKTINEMKHHNDLLEEAHEKLTNKLALFEKDLGNPATRSNLDIFFKEMESCIIGLHEVAEYFFEIYNNNNQTSEAYKIKSGGGDKKKIKEIFSKSNSNSIVLELLDPKFIASKMNEFKELKLKLNDIRTFAGLINLNDL